MKLKDLQLTIRNAGMRGAWYDLGYRIGKKAVRLLVLQGMVLTPETLDRSFLEGNPRYGHGFLTAEQLRAFAEVPGLELDPAFVTQALARGDRCYGIVDPKDGGTLASYGWYSTQPTPIDDALTLHFAPGWVYMYKGYTGHAYRGQRLHAIGMARSLMAHVDLGLRGIVSQVERNNFSSLKSVHRMGYVDVGRVRAWRAWGAWHIRADRGCAAYGLRLEAS